MAPEAEDRLSSLLARRRALLGPAYRTFYERPIEIVRGEGVHLFDRDGTEYLDAYNNVPVVGHSHPRVVAAIAEQAGRLNTNTRYPAEPILDYAERVLGTLGTDLDRVMFTCSGSEANDLALRIARFWTGKAGLVVTANAYHGVTAAVAEASPSLGSSVAPGPSVRTIPPPAPAAEDAEAVGGRMAAELRSAVAELEAGGTGFAALLIDSIFSSDGIVPDPIGFLRPVAEAVRAAGGLLIVDEVQAGFGRTGGMWGFQRHRLEPDLVTMGKPMGNGMPVAAVAGRAELLDRFGRQVRYFNTFGGSSVSIAAATAVLDVIQQEDLMENAADVGIYLRTGLEGLVARSPILCNVRGAGLFVAADAIAPDGDQAQVASRILNGLRDRRVLVGTTGMRGEVLKIRPPLVFARADADRLLEALEGVLRTLA
ncbi:MAG: aspartate aminotransferase family protein [Solirubrobacterales bacterium]